MAERASTYCAVCFHLKKMYLCINSQI